MTTYGFSMGDQLKAQRLRKQGMCWEQIGREMGMRPEAIRRALDPKWCNKARAKTQKHASEMREVAANRRAARTDHDVRLEKAPEYVLQERAVRLAVELDPIKELLGEPRRGYSALDQRRAR
jgi:hypothetical protein